jgi:hypothetical protein
MTCRMAYKKKKAPQEALNYRLLGGGAGIRTLEARFSALTPLAGEPLQPLGHASEKYDILSRRRRL